MAVYGRYNIDLGNTIMIVIPLLNLDTLFEGVVFLSACPVYIATSGISISPKIWFRRQYTNSYFSFLDQIRLIRP